MHYLFRTFPKAQNHIEQLAAHCPAVRICFHLNLEKTCVVGRFPLVHVFLLGLSDRHCLTVAL